MTDTSLVRVANEPMQAAMAFASELAKAELLPKPYQRKPAMILMAMELSKDLGCSVVAVMNGTYEIGGRLAYYTDFMLAQARRMGVIRSVSYETSGQGATLAVTARAVMAHGEVVEATVGMPEAQAEGWTRNSKYRTSPEQMLRKRAVKRLISNHCPEVMLGAAAEGDEDDSHQGAPQGPANASSVARLTSVLTPRAAIQGLKNDTSPEGRAALVSTYVAEAMPEPEVAEQAPQPAPATVTPIKPPVGERPPAADPEVLEARAEALKVTLEDAGAGDVKVHAEGRVVYFDSTCDGHRQMVAQVLKDKGFDLRSSWVKLHKPQLFAFLDADKDRRATLEDVARGVEEYVLAHPPKGEAK